MTEGRDASKAQLSLEARESAPEDAPGVETLCDSEGTLWRPGESFPATDGCNTCSCNEGGAIYCTLRFCTSCSPLNEPTRDYASQDAEECTRLDLRCPAGREPFTNECGCGCEEICSVDGSIYRVGDGFPSPDGCNTCSCLAGGRIVCTRRFCGGISGP